MMCVCIYICIHTSYKEKAVTCKPERDSSRTESCWCPNLGPPVCRTMKKCLLFQPLFLWYAVIAA